MSFNYTINPPCTSAQPVKKSDGDVIKPIRYNGVGCPAVILTDNKMMCSNGDITTPNNLPRNWDVLGYNNKNDESSNIVLSNNNDITFIEGETVYVENVKQTLQQIFSPNSFDTFLLWNPMLLSELANISRGCGSSSTIRLKGKIAAITNNSILGNGRIRWGNLYFDRNTKEFPIQWPSEIFWLELFNGEELGLNNFNIGSSANDIYIQYQQGESDEWIDTISLSKLFGGKALFPVLREQITNLQTRMLLQKTSTINRSQIMNTPRFRKTGSCGVGALCLDTTLTPSFKNSTKNMYLAPIPYGQRLGNTFRSSQLRGTKKIVRKNCIDPQFGRLVGTGGARIVNKF